MNIEIFNKLVKVETFKVEFINKNFISNLNDKRINKFLSIKKKKQTYQSALRYFNQFDNKKNLYLAIIDKKKKKLVGTITLRKIKTKAYFIGFMIGNYKYIGSKYVNDAINMCLCFVFDHFKALSIVAGTNKHNLSSNFCLVKNGFRIFKKTQRSFFFKLSKKNLNFTTNYKTKKND